MMRLLAIIDWLKLATWIIMLGLGLSFWVFLISCTTTGLQMGGVISNPAFYCPHAIDSAVLERIQQVTPVHTLTWEQLQRASASRRTTYGFQLGNSVWIYENLNHPEETLYHEYCHIYEIFYLDSHQDDPHTGWLNSEPYGYKERVNAIDLGAVNWVRE